jgi:hypothetical protein
MNTETSRSATAQKITILLAEYSSLRAEINSRNALVFQIGAVSAVSITWLLQQADISSKKFWVGVIILLTGTAIFGWVNIRDIWKASGRLRELEHDINSRAGEHLLIWETLWGAAKFRWLSSIFGMHGASDRSQLRRLDSQKVEEPH